MERPLTKYDLDFLEDVPGAKQLVIDFLEAIIKDSEHHDNRFTVSPVWVGDRRPVRMGTSYRLAEKRGLSIIDNPRTLPSDITGRLLKQGWIEPEPNKQYAHDPKRFTARALAWYEQFGGPNDYVVQRAIGRTIADAGPNGLPRSALGAIADGVGVSLARVEALAQLIIDSNVVTQRGHPPTLHLDTLAGKMWTLREFCPLSELPSAVFLPPAEVPLAEVPSLVRPRSSLLSAPGEENPRDVFISFASEDLNEVAQPLYDALTEAGLNIWFAPISLKIGDSQRREIDQGIATSRFAVVILSRDYLNKGWPKYELDGIFLKDVAGDQQLLPIWHNITKQEVIDFSPTLADKVARKTADRTIQEIADEIVSLIRAAP
jgi:hypothetical protein